MTELTATGRENSITVLSAATSLWTAGIGTGVEIPTFGAAAPGANNGTLQGAIGEKRLNRV